MGVIVGDIKTECVTEEVLKDPVAGTSVAEDVGSKVVGKNLSMKKTNLRARKASLSIVGYVKVKESCFQA